MAAVLTEAPCQDAGQHQEHEHESSHVLLPQWFPVWLSTAALGSFEAL